MNKSYRPYSHPRSAKCLCGSGLKFKRCCFDIYSNERPVGEAYKIFNAKRYKDALIQCRADITRYTIWHKSHTEPPVKAGFEPIYQLLELDIKALSEMVDLLLRCYERLNLIKDFPSVLDRLRENIKDERWRHRIIYFQALCELIPGWDKEAGKRELRKIGNIGEVDDVEILQLYLALNADELTFTTRINIIDRIISLADKWVDVLQYRSLKAIQLLLIGDKEDAKSILTNAIDQARENIDEKITGYQALRMADAISLLIPLAEKDELAEEAIDLYKKALDGENWRPSGIAEVYRCIGDAWRYKGNWEKAKQNYKKCLEISPNNVARVFLSECCLYSDELSEAESILNDIILMKLDWSGYCDYAFVKAAISTASGKKEGLDDAEQTLRSIEFKEPFFEKRKQELILSILDCKIKGTNEGIIKRVILSLKGVMRSANRYLLLQPNFMGIGLNVNKVIKDFEAEHNKRNGVTSNIGVQGTAQTSRRP